MNTSDLHVMTTSSPLHHHSPIGFKIRVETLQGIGESTVCSEGGVEGDLVLHLQYEIRGEKGEKGVRAEKRDRRGKRYEEYATIGRWRENKEEGSNREHTLA